MPHPSIPSLSTTLPYFLPLTIVFASVLFESGYVLIPPKYYFRGPLVAPTNY